MVLDFAAIEAICDLDGVDLDVGIETTITHELGHAIQELLGLKARSEKQAEAFAREWWGNRQFASLTQRRLRLKTSTARHRERLEDVHV
jgi:hypothetical protein